MKTKAVHEYEDCKLAGRCKKQRQWNMGGKGRNQGLFFFLTKNPIHASRASFRRDKTSGIKRDIFFFPTENSIHARHAQVSEMTKPPESTRGNIKYFQSIPQLTGSLSSTVVCFPSPSESTKSFPVGWIYKRHYPCALNRQLSALQV